MENSIEIPLKRRGQENRIISKSGKPLLVTVEGSDISAMIEKGLEAIGGLAKFIGSSKSVLLKPNTNQRDPFPSITAPETLRAVADYCRKSGIQKIIVHEDHKFEMDPYYTNEDLPDADIQLSHASDVSHFVLVEYEKWHGDMDSETAMQGREPMGPEGFLKSGFTKTEGPCIRVATQIHESPFIINMPVLKRHFAGQMTSALKNHFGSVYGPHRWIAHAAIQNQRDYYDRKLAEFASAVRPELTITDIRSLQAVSGPFIGEDTKIIKDVNKVIITGDMIAADVVAMNILKKHDNTFTPENEAIVRRQHEHAEELGIGTGDLSVFEMIELKV